MQEQKNKNTSLKLFKRILRIIGKSIITLILFAIFYLLLAICLQDITIDKEKIYVQKEVTIYIITNGVHTDIAVPATNQLMDWTQEVKYSNTTAANSNYSYLAMGWGDKGFYLETPYWEDLKLSVAFKAAFGLSSTAIHATYYKEMKVSETCKKIKISNAQYLRLIDYLFNSFQKDANGHLINIKTNANYGNSDTFYEATGRYNLFYTCNTWANSGLKSCGQKCCLWTPFDSGIFSKYK